MAKPKTIAEELEYVAGILEKCLITRDEKERHGMINEAICCVDALKVVV